MQVVAPCRMERLRRFRSPGLQPEGHPVGIGKCADALFVGRRQRLQYAQHQHVPVLGQRHFDLRQAVMDAEAADQFAQTRQQV